MKQQENLRQLASLLDLRLGIDARKIILEGNEKLTRKTKPSDWTAWISGVERRVSLLSAGRPDRDILLRACTEAERLNGSIQENQ